MKYKLVVFFIICPFLLFSQYNKPFDDFILGLNFGIGNSFYTNKALNAFLIENGYFSVFENNKIERPPNTINIGVEVIEKNHFCFSDFRL